MKNKKGIWFVLLPVVLTLSIFIVFYDNIESKPTDAGFWFIFVLGMSFGLALSKIILWFKSKK